MNNTKPYSLVVFVNEKNSNGKAVDTMPTSWLFKGDCRQWQATPLVPSGGASGIGDPSNS